MTRFFSLTILALLLSNPTMARVGCKDFATQAQAQAYFDAKKAGYKNLDRDKDGRACDCNKGGNGTHCPKHKGKRK